MGFVGAALAEGVKGNLHGRRIESGQVLHGAITATKGFYIATAEAEVRHINASYLVAIHAC